MTEPMSERRFNELHAMAWNPEFQPPPEMPDLRRRNDGFRDAVREIGRFRGRVAYGPDAVHALIQILADHRVLALADEAGVTSELLTALTQWASVTVARESHAAVERAERAEAEVARYRAFCGEAFCGDVERDRDALAAEVERLRALIADEHSRLSQDLDNEQAWRDRAADRLDHLADLNPHKVPGWLAGVRAAAKTLRHEPGFDTVRAETESSYADKVDAPLPKATIVALRNALKSGDYARFKKPKPGVVALYPEDLRIDAFSNGAETHVRVTHLPTGAVGTGHDPENPHSRLAAKEMALRELLAALESAAGNDDA